MPLRDGLLKLKKVHLSEVIKGYAKTSTIAPICAAYKELRCEESKKDIRNSEKSQ